MSGVRCCGAELVAFVTAQLKTRGQVLVSPSDTWGLLAEIDPWAQSGASRALCIAILSNVEAKPGERPEGKGCGMSTAWLLGAQPEHAQPAARDAGTPGCTRLLRGSRILFQFMIIGWNRVCISFGAHSM